MNDHITITTADNMILTYRILEIRTTDAYDPAYALIYGDSHTAYEYLVGLNAPADSSNLLMLSTCLHTGTGGADVVIDVGTDTVYETDEYGGRDNVGRLIVFASLVHVRI